MWDDCAELIKQNKKFERRKWVATAKIELVSRTKIVQMSNFV